LVWKWGRAACPCAASWPTDLKRIFSEAAEGLVSLAKYGEIHALFRQEGETTLQKSVSYLWLLKPAKSVIVIFS